MLKEILESLKELRSEVQEIFIILRGDPTDLNKPGFHLRLDRLESKTKTQNKLLWVIGATLITTVVSKIL